MLKITRNIAANSCKIIILLLTLQCSSLGSKAQNLVPNPGFEDTLGCFSLPSSDCLIAWTTFSGGALNTSDVCYNGAVFFPVSSIPAFEGNNYLGMECNTFNPEFMQTQLLQPLQAGVTYCVTFRAAVCDQFNQVQVNMGVHFSTTAIVSNPTISGLTAHVEGSVNPDPTVWTKITGTYTANGGENFITLGCFNNPDTIGGPYMYMDMIEVVALPAASNSTQQLCDSSIVLLSASGPAADSYLWSTNATTPSITANTTGTYFVERFYGDCSVTDTFYVNDLLCNDSTVNPIDEPFTLFFPTAFSPDGNGVNDVFQFYSEGIDKVEWRIYNRWGELIFESKNFSTWDGRHDGKMCEAGVYVFQLNGISHQAEYITKTGHIVLLR